MMRSSLVTKKIVELCSKCTSLYILSKHGQSPFCYKSVWLVCNLSGLEQLAQKPSHSDNDMDAQGHQFTH